MEIKKFVFGETLEQAIEVIPEEYQLKFYRIIKNYGLHGIEPELSGFELATWVVMKAMIDITIPKKHNASPVGKVGAPYGNKNAQKTIENNSENNQNNSDELNSQNNSENNKQLLPNDNDNVNDNVNGNSDDNDNSQKQPSLFLKIKNKIKENGYFLDDDSAIERLITETDPSWFDDRYGFIDYIAETVRDSYSAKQKSQGDLHNLFRKLLFNAPNLREAYPPWKAEQEKQAQATAKKAAIAEAKRIYPAKCDYCGGSELSRSYDDMYYCTCGAVCSFDTEKIKWVWRK